MRRASLSFWRFALPAICILTVGVKTANADQVGLSNGGFLTGGAVYILLASPQSGEEVSVCATPAVGCPGWSIASSSTGAVWNNNNIAFQYSTNFSTGGPGAFMDLGLSSSQGNFLNLVLNVKVDQFFQQLQALPFMQSFQVPLLTTKPADVLGCIFNAPLACSGEYDANGNVSFIVAGAMLTITNDPGFYQETLTTVPLNQTPVPEPSSLLMLGSSLLALGPILRQRVRPA